MEKPYLSAKEIADELDIALPKVWRLIRDGELPAHRIGRDYRIARADFEEFMRKRRTTGTEGTNGVKEQRVA